MASSLVGIEEATKETRDEPIAEEALGAATAKNESEIEVHVDIERQGCRPDPVVVAAPVGSKKDDLAGSRGNETKDGWQET